MNVPWMQLKPVDAGSHLGSIVCTSIAVNDHHPMMMCGVVGDLGRPADSTYCYFDQHTQETNCDIVKMECTGGNCVLKQLASPAELQEKGFTDFIFLQPAKPPQVGDTVLMTGPLGVKSWLANFVRFSEQQ